MLQPEEVFCEEKSVRAEWVFAAFAESTTSDTSIPVGEMKLDVLCLHEQRNIPLTYVVQDQYRICIRNKIDRNNEAILIARGKEYLPGL